MRLNAAIYAPLGVDLLSFAATAPGPILYVDFKGNTRHLPDLTDWEGGDITTNSVVQVRTFKDFDSVLRRLSGLDNGPETLVINTLDEWQDRLLQDLVPVHEVDDEAKISQAIWLKVLRLMNTQLHQLRDLAVQGTMNTVILSAAEIKTTPDDVSRPALKGGMVRAFPGLVEVLGFLDEELTRIDGKSVRVQVLNITNKPGLNAQVNCEPQSLRKYGPSIIKPSLQTIVKALNKKETTS